MFVHVKVLISPRLIKYLTFFQFHFFLLRILLSSLKNMCNNLRQQQHQLYWKSLEPFKRKKKLKEENNKNLWHLKFFSYFSSSWIFYKFKNCQAKSTEFVAKFSSICSIHIQKFRPQREIWHGSQIRTKSILLSSLLDKKKIKRVYFNSKIVEYYGYWKRLSASRNGANLMGKNYKTQNLSTNKWPTKSMHNILSQIHNTNC